MQIESRMCAWCKKIDVEWKRPDIGNTLYDAYRRWVDYWGEE